MNIKAFILSILILQSGLNLYANTNWTNEELILEVGFVALFYMDMEQTKNSEEKVLKK